MPTLDELTHKQLNIIQEIVVRNTSAATYKKLCLYV